MAILMIASHSRPSSNALRHFAAGASESINIRLRDELPNREIFYSLRAVQMVTES